MIIVDGSPGIGCPVIASVTGANLVLIVTEPTMSGLHDLDRVADLTRHFGIPPAICINKYDINPEMAANIGTHAEKRGIEVLGRIRYDKAVTQAQIAKLSAVEFDHSAAADDMRELWTRTYDRLTQ